VQKWLGICLENHDLCNYDIEEHWRPTRLIELDRPHEGCVTLNCWSTETMKTTNSVAYATLSHCWGYRNPLKLIGSTFSALSKGVQVSSLPKTFQDAIAITHQLGLKFVWIDSLCIFQDSREDWVKESSLMGKVYSQALCNIGATASSDSSEGCFRSRNPRQLDRTLIRSSWTDVSNSEYLLLADRTKDEGRLLPPLLNRGWVVQEHILSRRFLHFDCQQVLFECRHGTASEMFPEFEVATRPPAPSSSIWLTQPLWKPGTPDELIYHNIKYHRKNAAVHGFWGRLVRYYSRCRLSFESDRLIAISGLAKILQQCLGDRYLAGIWESSLPKSLLWIAKKQVRPGTCVQVFSPMPYVAPTWSWASLNASVHFPGFVVFQPNKDIVRVMQTEVISATSDPTGAILSAFIRLRGNLKSVILHWDLESGYYAHIKSMLKKGNLNHFPFQDVYLDKAIATSANGIDLEFMPVVENELSRKRFQFYGLLLAPTGERLGQYRRVGVLRCLPFYPNHCEYLGGPLSKDAFKSIDNHDPGWAEYEEFDSVDQYTISVV